MKKLEWNWYRDVYPRFYENPDDYINHYIEKSKKNKNCWWSSLPSMTGKDKGLLSYFKRKLEELHKTGDDSFLTAGSSPLTAKACPAINTLLDDSYILKTPTDIFINIEGNDVIVYPYSVDWDIDIGRHPNNQFHTESNNPFEGYMNVKFQLPILLNNNNIPYIYLHPQYHSDNLPFTVINGVVNKDYKHEPLNINTLIKVGESKTYRIKAGTPLAYIWFPEKTELVYNPKLHFPLKTSLTGKPLFK